MAFTIEPRGDLEYFYEEELYTAEPRFVKFYKVGALRFKEDTQTMIFEFAAELVDGSIAKWDVCVEVGLTIEHDVSCNGVTGIPETITIDYDPEFICVPQD
ncbi:hypothetical protein LF927_09105 [Pectobacterium polaris]|uniref:hypothetical protein n=1 Tax=Pectobacterium polaris TaxID=2042057 RepID=UPI001CF279B2|nr:hypothetical protein [Pectobacterium polaris]MCA6941341.1 hypothetical protein [Pectobacterium polaris]MCA6956395.1 hypothetical protein [Pectobacterium polaris]